MHTHIMVSTDYFPNPSPPGRWYKFKTDSALPFTVLQVVEGTGVSKIDPVRKIAVKYLPARGTSPGMPRDYDDFTDFVEDLAAGGTFVFTIVCDSDCLMADFTWRRYTGTRRLSSAEILLVEATDTIGHLHTFVRKSVPPNLEDQLAEIRSLLQMVVERHQLESGYPQGIPEAEAEEAEEGGLRRSG